MQAVNVVKPVADSIPNPYIGFWGMKLEQQNQLLKNQFDQRKLSLDPRMGYAIIGTSGQNIGIILNPPNNNGKLSFFVDLNLAEQYVKAREMWFKENNIPVSDVQVGRFCPANRCAHCKK